MMAEIERLRELWAKVPDDWLAWDELYKEIPALLTRLEALEGALQGITIGKHFTRTWFNEAGHYCMEIIPDDEFYAVPPLAPKENRNERAN